MGLYHFKGLIYDVHCNIKFPKDGFKGSISLISWMGVGCWVFFVRKKQQYHEEIALVTNLRPLKSQQSLKFSYIYCIVWMVNLFLKYSLISGAILTIDFAIFCQVTKLWNISEKDWPNLSNRRFLLSFLHTKNTQEGRAFMSSRNCFPIGIRTYYLKNL